MKDYKHSLPFLLIIASIFIAFFLKTFLYLDPDLGWYLKTGEIILNQGIPHTDLFSYTMSSYHYADHEWLSNLIIYILYSTFGKIGVSIVYSLIALAALLIMIPKGLLKFSYGPLILAASLILPFVGTRHQVIGWLFMSILIKVILDQKLWERFKYFIPLLFLVWANLHGSFLLGLMLLLLNQVKSITKFRFKKVDLVILLFSSLATLINPYGILLWKEVLASAIDQRLKFTIMEWQPLITQADLIIIFMISISLALAFKFRAEIKLTEKLFFLGFLLLAFLGQRSLPFWVLINVYLQTLILNWFYQQSIEKTDVKNRFIKVYKIYLIIFIFIFLVQTILILVKFSVYQEVNYYPTGAVKYLKTNPQTGQIFSLYEWGGYLIWNLPEYKTFIDGRMPSWKFMAPKDQTDDAFGDYLNIHSGSLNFSKQAAKYHITAVLLRNPPNPKPNILSKINDLLNKLRIYQFVPPKAFDLGQSLESNGWKKVYQDNISVIYESPN